MPTNIKRSILMIHPSASQGGGTIAFIKAAEAVRDLGSIQPILLFGSNGPASHYTQQEGFTTLIAPISTTPFNGILVGQRSLSIPYLLRFLRDFIPAQKALKKAIADHHIDMIYISTSGLLGTAYMAKRRNLPIIIHIREYVNGRTFSGQFTRYAIRNLADVLITNSIHSAKPFTTHERVYPIYDGVPLTPVCSGAVASNIRRKWGFTSETPIVGMVSPLIAYKGHMTLIEAMPTILKQHPDTRFVIVGGTPVPAKYWKTWKGRIRHYVLRQQDFLLTLKRMVREMGLDDYIIFDNWRDDIPFVLSALDVVVFPSLLPEGFGRPIVEAGSASRPIVASDIGPARELVINEKTGLLFPPGYAKALADCVSTLLGNPDLAKAMGEAGRKRVENIFSDGHHRVALSELFERELSNS